MLVFVLVMTLGFAWMAVVAAIIPVATVTPVVIIIVAVGIADRAASAAAHGCADQPTRAATDLLADDITASRAAATTNGPFGTAAFVRTDPAPSRAANAPPHSGARPAPHIPSPPH